MALNIYATSTDSITSPNQLQNKKYYPDKNWLSFGNNKLDGTYHFPEPTYSGEYEIGWWSGISSNLLGKFEEDLIITFEISEQDVSVFSLLGDGNTNNYPVDFDLRFYDSEDNLLGTEEIRGNTSHRWYRRFNYYSVTKIELEIYEINKSLTKARLLEAGVEGIDNLILTELMDASSRDIKARARVTYLNPVYQESVSINSSDTDTITSEQDLINDTMEPDRNWFSLGNNKLDGTYHFPEPTYSGEYEIGWWSDKASDVNGEFTNHPIVNLTFTKQDVFGITIIGDNNTNNYPVDFNLNYYDDSDTLVYTDEIRDNVGNYSQRMAYLDIEKIELEILKINLPETKARLIEFSIKIVNVYNEDDIISLNILEEIDYEQNGVPIGAVSSNEIDIELMNEEDKFTLTNPNTDLTSLLKRNRKIEVELGVVDGSRIAWYPTGTYFTKDWEVSPESISVSTTARDRLQRLDSTEFKSSPLFENKSISYVLEYILQDAGLTVEDYNIDSSLDSVTLPYIWFGKMSHKKAIVRVSKFNLLNIYVDRDNVVQIGEVTPTATTKYTYDDDNVFKTKYPNSWNEEINRLKITTKTYEKDTESNVGKFKGSLTLSPGQIYTLEIDFTTNDVSEIQTPTYVKDADIQVNSVNNYCWGAEIEFENIGTTDQVLSEVKIRGKTLIEGSKNTVLIEDKESQDNNGINQVSYEHQLIQGMDYANSLAQDLFNIIQKSRFDLEMENRGHIGLTVGDKVIYKDSKYEQEVEYMITRQEINWVGTLSASTKCKKV